jgi:lysozyme
MILTCMLPVRKINQAGLDLVKMFEGCSLVAYWDALGDVWTIGWGHTGGDVHKGLELTQTEADAFLMMDLATFAVSVNRMLGEAPTTDNQFAALVSLAYNVGADAVMNSTLLRLHIGGNYLTAAVQFPRWDHAGGKVIPGLLRRRNAEAKLYLT